MLESNRKYFFVDLQGFKDKQNKFILKEISICTLQNEVFYHFIMKPPFKWKFLTKNEQKQATWLKERLHGFNWNDGYIHFYDLKKIINMLLQSNKKENTIIYVKGEEKIKWLQELFYIKTTISNIENIGCITNLNNTYNNSNKDDITHCRLHNYKFNCAYKNVISLKQWYKSNIV